MIPMLNRIKESLFPAPSAAPVVVPGVTREEVLTVRALTAFADGASASVAMGIFRGEGL